MPVVARVLIAFDQDRIAPCDEEAGSRIARKVVVERVGLAPHHVADRRLGTRAYERRRRGRTSNQPTLEDLVEMAVRANEERNSKEGHGIAAWIAIARPVLLGVRAIRGEARAGDGGRLAGGRAGRVRASRARGRWRCATGEENCRQAAGHKRSVDGAQQPAENRSTDVPARDPRQKVTPSPSSAAGGSEIARPRASTAHAPSSGASVAPWRSSTSCRSSAMWAMRIEAPIP
jgi:hypothetical protein